MNGMDNPLRIELPDPAQVEIFRGMRPADRVAAALRMSRLMRGIVTTQIRSRHPDWSESRIAAGLRERMHARRG